MYPAILSCRRPKIQVLRLSGTCIPAVSPVVSCRKRIVPISNLGERKGDLDHM